MKQVSLLAIVGATFLFCCDKEIVVVGRTNPTISVTTCLLTATIELVVLLVHAIQLIADLSKPECGNPGSLDELLAGTLVLDQSA